jgi:glycine cleavage system aminomethyltransferase T
LRRLEIDTPTPPEHGAKLKSGDVEAGEIASAVYSPALQKSVAMAYVKVPFSDPGTPLHCLDSQARVT